MKGIVKIAVLVISFMTICSLVFSSIHSGNGVLSDSVAPFVLSAEGESSDVVTFTARVLDQLNGKPIAGASVYLYGEGLTLIGFTNASGFLLSPPLLMGWEGAVEASAVSYRSSTGNWNHVFVGPLYSNGSVFVVQLVPKLLKTCDVDVVEKSKFKLGETVYVMGCGFPISDSGDWIDICVVKHTNWTDGMDIPPSIPGTATEININDDGEIMGGDSYAALVWSQANVTGKYDVVADLGSYLGGSSGKYDSGIDFLASFEVVAEYLFSDGFESGNFSNWTGTRQSAGETVSINNTYVHQGDYSAQFTSDGGEEREYAYCYVRSSASSADELYARAYFKITSSGIGNVVDTRFSLIVFKAGTNAIAFAGWRRTSNGVRWSLLIRDSLGWVTKYSAMNPSVNRWYCVELHWFKDATNGLAELFVDGDLVCAITGRNTAGFGGVNEVDFGLAGTLNCSSTTVYLDSAVTSTTYIGLLPFDKWFASIDYLPLDWDGDGYYEGIHIRINVDTSNMTAQVRLAFTLFLNGSPLTFSERRWIIKNKDVEYVYFSYGHESPLDITIFDPGLCSFAFTLYDSQGNVEDYHFDPNVVYICDDSLGSYDLWAFQDGFEYGNFSLESGVRITSGETACATRELSHAGNYSAKFMTNGDGGYESASCYRQASGYLPAADAYFNVAASGIKEDMDRFGLIQMKVSGNVVASAGWRCVNGIVRWSLVLRNGTNWVTALSNETPSTGQWYHVELYCAPDRNSPSEYGEGASLCVNEVLVCQITGVDTLFPLTSYEFGLPQAINCGSTTVYMDEVVADFYKIMPS